MTCIVPARNEAEQLHSLIEQIKTIKDITRIIIVEGGSVDTTWEEALKIEREYPDLIILIKQANTGKFDAVLSAAKYIDSKMFMIWDADGTVPLASNINLINCALSTHSPVIGDRLKGKIEPGAMQAANFVANWLFALIWVPIVGGKPADLLCGSKIFPTDILIEMPAWLKRLDPYGDFALISFARYKKLKINVVKVDYNKRSYGSTNINRWSGGIKLIKLTTLIYVRLFLIKLFKFYSHI